MTPQDEGLFLTKSDYRRFVAAVTGHEAADIGRYRLLTGFLPFAMPTWRLAGARQLPDDGASPEATPGLVARTGGILALGQDLTVHQPYALYEPLRRSTRLVADEEKTGRSGRFRLVTIERETLAGRGVLVTQQERYAVRRRS